MVVGETAQVTLCYTPQDGALRMDALGNRLVDSSRTYETDAQSGTFPL